MTTSLGKLLRKWRIDKGVVMNDMAKSLGVSNAFLSAVERGKKSINKERQEEIREYFGLDDKDYEILLNEADKSNGQVEISLSHKDEQSQNDILAFARKYSNLSEDAKERMRRLLHDDE